MGDTISKCFSAPQDKADADQEQQQGGGNKNKKKHQTLAAVSGDQIDTKSKYRSIAEHHDRDLDQNDVDEDQEGDRNDNKENHRKQQKQSSPKNTGKTTSSASSSPSSATRPLLPYEDFFSIKPPQQYEQHFKEKVQIFGSDDEALTSMVPVAREQHAPVDSGDPLSTFYCAAGSEDGNLVLYCPKTRKVVCSAKPHSSEITHLRYNATSQLLYGASCDRKISIHQIGASTSSPVAMRLKLYLEGHTLSVTAMDTRPDDSSFLVSGSRDNTVRIWDCERGECLDLVDVKLNIVHCVKWIPAMKCVAQGGEDLTIRLWDIRTSGSGGNNNNTATTLDLADTMMGFDYHPICCDVVNDGVGHTLVVGHNGFNDTGSTISFWDLRMRKLLRHCEGHSNTVRRICASQTTSMIVTGSDDQTMKLWKSDYYNYNDEDDGNDNDEEGRKDDDDADGENDDRRNRNIKMSNNNNNDDDDSNYGQCSSEQEAAGDRRGRQLSANSIGSASSSTTFNTTPASLTTANTTSWASPTNFLSTNNVNNMNISNRSGGGSAVVATAKVTSRVSTLASHIVSSPVLGRTDEIIVAGFRDGEISAWGIIKNSSNQNNDLVRLRYLA